MMKVVVVFTDRIGTGWTVRGGAFQPGESGVVRRGSHVSAAGRRASGSVENYRGKQQAVAAAGGVPAVDSLATKRLGIH